VTLCAILELRPDFQASCGAVLLWRFLEDAGALWCCDAPLDVLGCCISVALDFLELG
jgi:hypothetical protein